MGMEDLDLGRGMVDVDRGEGDDMFVCICICRWVDQIDMSILILHINYTFTHGLLNNKYGIHDILYHSISRGMFQEARHNLLVGVDRTEKRIDKMR